MQVTEEALVPAGEGKERHRSRNPHVYTQHSRLHLADKLPRSRAVGREDGSAVAKGKAIHRGDGLVERPRAHERQHRAEDFFLKQPHPRPDSIDKRWGDEKAAAGNLAAT